MERALPQKILYTDLQLWYLNNKCLQAVWGYAAYFSQRNRTARQRINYCK